MATLAGQISDKTKETLISRLGLKEIKGSAGDAFLPLTAPKFGNAHVGDMRVWDASHNDQLLKMVYIGITVDAIGMDSHMIYVYSKPDSLLPNFTLDSVSMNMPAGVDERFPDGMESYAFHLDLVPRVDLGVNLPYMEKCYMPLTDIQAECLAHEGITAANISPAQRAIMSPWMLAQRSTAEAYEKIVFPSGEKYLNHWLGLVDDGLKDVPVIGIDNAQREDANRKLIFSRELDPVWAQIDNMVGAETSDYQIEILRNLAVDKPR
jgi:hypothetical protein